MPPRSLPLMTPARRKAVGAPQHLTTASGTTIRVADIKRMELADLGLQWIRAVTDDGATHLLDGNTAALAAGTVIPETRETFLVEVADGPAGASLRSTPIVGWVCLGQVPAAITLAGIQPKPLSDIAIRFGATGPIHTGDGQCFGSDAAYLKRVQAPEQAEAHAEPYCAPHHLH